MASSMDVAGFTFFNTLAVITPRMVPVTVEESGGRGGGGGKGGGREKEE